MRQRSQVAAGAHRSFFRNHRAHAPVQNRHQLLDGWQPDTGVPPGQVFNPQGQDGSDGFFIECFSDPGGMAHQNVFLKLAGIFFRYGDIAEGTEPGGDPINSALLLDPSFDEMTAFDNLFFGVGGQLDLSGVARNGYQVCQCHALHTQKYGLHRIGLTFTLGRFGLLGPLSPLKKGCFRISIITGKRAPCA